MAIPHWLIRLAIFAALGAFVVFAFRQATSVSREDRDEGGSKSPQDLLEHQTKTAELGAREAA